MDIIKPLVSNIIPTSEKSISGIMQDNTAYYLAICGRSEGVDQRRPCTALADCHSGGSYVADYSSGIDK